ANGWLGRSLDALSPAPEAGSGAESEAFPRGMSLTDALPQALQAGRVTVPVVGQLDSFGEDDKTRVALLRKLSTRRVGSGSIDSGHGPATFLRRQADTLYRTADRLKAAVEKTRPMAEVEYPAGE